MLSLQLLQHPYKIHIQGRLDEDGSARYSLYILKARILLFLYVLVCGHVDCARFYFLVRPWVVCVCVIICLYATFLKNADPGLLLNNVNLQLNLTADSVQKMNQQQLFSFHPSAACISSRVRAFGRGSFASSIIGYSSHFSSFSAV